MEFSIDELDRIIMDLYNEPSVPSPTRVTDSPSATAIKQEPSDSNEKEQSFTTANNMTDRQYCFIVFNNRRWSELRQKRSTPTEQQQIVREIVQNAPSTPPDVALDNLFIAQLRKLINDYMARTKRPFPIKYWLDLTTF